MKRAAVLLAILLPLKAVALGPAEQQLIDQYIAGRPAPSRPVPQVSLEEVKRQLDALTPEIVQAGDDIKNNVQNTKYIKDNLARRLEAVKSNPDTTMYRLPNWLRSMRREVTKFCCTVRHDPKAYAKAVEDHKKRDALLNHTPDGED